MCDALQLNWKLSPSKRTAKTDNGGMEKKKKSRKERNNNSKNLAPNSKIVLKGPPKKRGPKPRPKSAPMSKYRRKTANMRERVRMGEINKAFEKLRERIPNPVLSGRSKCEKLTKINILHVAINYIRAMERLLHTGDSGIRSFSEMVRNPIRPEETRVKIEFDEFVFDNNNDNDNDKNAVFAFYEENRSKRLAAKAEHAANSKATFKQPLAESSESSSNERKKVINNNNSSAVVDQSSVNEVEMPNSSVMKATKTSRMQSCSSLSCSSLSGLDPLLCEPNSKLESFSPDLNCNTLFFSSDSELLNDVLGIVDNLDQHELMELQIDTNNHFEFLNKC